MNQRFGVANFTGADSTKLKRAALLFDGIYLARQRATKCEIRSHVQPAITTQLWYEPELPELDFLHNQKVLLEVPDDGTISSFGPNYLDRIKALRRVNQVPNLTILQKERHILKMTNDLYTRNLACQLNEKLSLDTVPILSKSPTALLGSVSHQHEIVEVALHSIPVPDENCAWEKIIDIRHELREKKWGFNRFLHGLATATKTPAEIQDEIEWNLHLYRGTNWIFGIAGAIGFGTPNREIYIVGDSRCSRHGGKSRRHRDSVRQGDTRAREGFHWYILSAARPSGSDCDLIKIGSDHETGGTDSRLISWLGKRGPPPLDCGGPFSTVRKRASSAASSV